jgi:3'-phosphoadenosine 5'-phosphosulfate sulfotransferase (PAPS reductase)/FAD synthetase
MNNRVQRWQLVQRTNQPLEVKILMSMARIKAWYDHWDGEVYVAFSGGLDSTALLHMVRTIYPDVPATFDNTGVEYPEIVRHVRQTENVTWLKPKMRFPQIIRHYGYPVISKRIAQYIKEVQRAKTENATKRLRLTGIRSDGTYSSMGKISYKWQYLCNAPFPIHDGCCNVLKKNPAKKAEAEFGKPFLGIRAEESEQRTQTYYSFGCNAFNLKRPRSWPIAFWTHQDVWNYIKLHDIPYSALYDMGYQSSGCFPCMFGVHLEREPNRFQRMRVTHPKLWEYCIHKLELAKVLDYIHVPYDEPLQPRLF